MENQIKSAIEKHVEPKVGNPFPIVCVKSYEFEGNTVKAGDISYKAWGTHMPDNWRRATKEDIENYVFGLTPPLTQGVND